MPVRIADIAQKIDPVCSNTRLLVVWNRFQDDAQLHSLPVVDEGKPVGLLTRSKLATGLLSTANTASSVLGQVSDVLIDDPITAELITPVSYVAKENADAARDSLMAGVIAVDDGEYAGLATADAILKTVAEENAARANLIQAQAKRIENQKSIADRTIEKNNRFLAFVSHEIRTSLTGTLGIADLLAEAGLNEPYRGYAETISDSGRLLERLLTDLLDISRLNANKMPILPEPFRLADFANETRVHWTQQAGARNISLNVNCLADANARIEADAIRLRQVLYNLVSNALKFSESSKVEVTLDLNDASGDSLALNMTVSDTGMGISAEDKERLFGIFEQAKTDTVYRFGGSGLGLAIAKGLTERMGGQIALQDRPGGGSIFEVMCPVKRAGPRLAVRNEMPRLANLKLGKVLIVDDHEASRTVLFNALRDAGWSVDVVATPEQAIRRAGSVPYQAVLLDLHLGSASGLQIARHLRGNEGPNRNTLMMAVTADARITVNDACKNAGFDGVLTKPLRPKELVANLMDALISSSHYEPVGAQLSRLNAAIS
ncbi:MAG: ATP-binding protein [Pseudomonadota bacterium]